MILSKRRDDKPSLLTSKEDFQKIADKLSGIRLFAGREVTIRGQYTLCERFCAMVYYCTGNKKGMNALQAPYNKKYLSRELANLLSAYQISAKDKDRLKYLIKQSFTFQQKVNQIDRLTVQDMMLIRMEVAVKIEYQSNSGSSEELPKKSSDSQVCALNDLAKSYLEIKDIPNAIDCYKRILDLPKPLNDSTLFDALSALADCYEKTNDTDNQIKCLERISNRSGIVQSDRISLLNKLQTLYHKTGKIDKEIITLRGLATIYSRSLSSLNEAIKCHLCIFNLAGAKLEDKIGALNCLINNYALNEDTTNRIKCYERVINLPGVSYQDQRAALLGLAGIYRDDRVFKSSPKEIESYERILEIQGINLLHKLQALDMLIGLHRQTKNIAKEIECHERVFLISPFFSLVKDSAAPSTSGKLTALQSLATVYKNTGDTTNEIKSHWRIVNLTPGVIPILIVK